MDDIVKDFLIESGENLDRLDEELVRLESNPSKQLLAGVFRTIHTLKGSCGFLGFSRLEKVAHTGESLLSRLRDGDLTLSAELTSGLLAMVDAVRRMLADIQATGADGVDDYTELLERLMQLQSGTNSPTQADGSSTVEMASAASEEEAAGTGTAQEEAPDAVAHGPVAGKIGALLVESGMIRPEDLAEALQAQARGDPRRVGEILMERKQEDVLAIQRVLDPRGQGTTSETVRIAVKLLDRLMNLVGEMVLARNQLLQVSLRAPDPGLQAVSQRMNLIATELQEQVMKTRMQPIGNIWSKFSRTVRRGLVFE
jgi:two-component system, chemotaxis family, sensor kinase CheA